MIKMNFVRRSIFFLSIPITLVILSIISQSEISQNYPFILNSLISIAVVSFYLLYVSFERHESWHNPFNITLLFQIVFSILGIIVYELREAFWTNLPADMNIVGKAVLIAPTMMILGNIISRGIFRKRSEYSLMVFSRKRLRWTIIALTILGNLAAIKLFDFYRSIPLFSSNIDASRLQITSYSAGRGSLFILLLLLIISIPLIYIQLMTKKNKRIRDYFLFVFEFLLCYIPLLFYGGRFYFLAPILLTFVAHSVFINKITVRQAFVFGGIILVVAMIFVIFRIFGTDVDKYYAFRALWADLFPEIRAFGFIAYEVQNPQIYGKIINNFLVSLFPSVIFDFFNLNKQLYLFRIGDYVASIIGSSLPIRLGLLGESYLAYGIRGVIIAYSTLGFMLGLITAKFEKLHVNDVRKFQGLAFGVIAALIIPYGSNMVLTLFFCSIFTNFVTLAISTKKT